MHISILRRYLNELVSINLKNGNYYKGQILEIIEETDIIFLDKNNTEVGISSEEIIAIKKIEVRE